MIKDFKGQVKVADIQAAFDEIVNRINKQVDIYNDAAGLSDIDYTKGSPKLSNAGYTLSVGGLKSVIDAYNGTLIGCRAYRLSDTSVLVSDGLYFKDGQVYRINSRVVAGESEWDLSDLYYDIDNDTVMFKNGSTSDVVEVETGWTQPTINSNTDCGVFTASVNSQDAYKCTGSGWQCLFNVGFNDTTFNRTENVTWNLPKTVKNSTISFHVEGFLFNSRIEVVVDGITEHSESFADWQSIDRNITLTLDRDVNSIKINIHMEGVLSYPLISNLLVTGNSNSYAIETGGVITPSDNIIKIAHLNWESENLVLNSIEGFQLENVKDVKLVSQNREIDPHGGGSYEPWNNSTSGKFVAYTSTFFNGNSTFGGTTTFMGLQLTGGYGDGGSGRNHYSVTALSLIYIPKGFTPTDSKTGYSGRNVFSSKLIR